MIIKSYLAYPQPGKRLQLEQTLIAMAGCDVIPATNRDLLILITESENKQTEDDLVARLKSLAALQTLTLVSGFNEDAAQAHGNGEIEERQSSATKDKRGDWA